jgi:hypothetical protein
MPKNLRAYQGLDRWIGKDVGDDDLGLPRDHNATKIKHDVQDDFSQEHLTIDAQAILL